jgi:hypothetical protein
MSAQGHSSGQVRIWTIRPVSIWGRIVATVVTIVVLAFALAFSILLFALIFAVITVGVVYAVWAQHRMRAQAARGGDHTEDRASARPDGHRNS